MPTWLSIQSVCATPAGVHGGRVIDLHDKQRGQYSGTENFRKVWIALALSVSSIGVLWMQVVEGDVDRCHCCEQKWALHDATRRKLDLIIPSIHS